MRSRIVAVDLSPPCSDVKEVAAAETCGFGAIMAVARRWVVVRQPADLMPCRPLCALS